MNLDYKCYGEIVDQLQNTVYWQLREDANVASFILIGDDKYNIYDGDPTTQGRIGFPYVVVHTPTVSELPLSMRNRQVELIVKIEIFDKKEKNVRELTDAIRNALAVEAVRTRVKGFHNQRIMNSSLASRFLPNESSKAVWVYILFVRYTWRGPKV